MEDSQEHCIEQFMAEADKLGIYVLVPGTGTTWGYLPGVNACQPATSDGCYKTGGVLGWGQTMLRFFNYPNTLAIVLGNEFDQQLPQYMPVIRAYARDMKSHMDMCDSNSDSPTKGQMRRIPLAYASSDDKGDAGVKPKADYLFCGDAAESVDIFGLNVERWCSTAQGPGQYNAVNKWVTQAAYPGAFMFTEMGCSTEPYKGARDWAQIPGFFSNYTSVDGFIAYTYYGNPDFNMFDGPTAAAKEYQDGVNFFKQTKNIGDLPQRKSVAVQHPSCADTMLGHKMDSVDSVEYYNTGKAGQAAQCPKPPQPYAQAELDDLAQEHITSEVQV